MKRLERRNLLTKAGLGSFAAALAGAPIAAAPTPPVGSPFLNLRDYGAVGDNKTNDGPALRKALNALAAAGGGQLVIPPGKFVIRTGMAEPVDYLNKASSIRLVGCGSASQLLIRTGKEGVAVKIANLDSLVVEGLDFVGAVGERNDARIVFLAAYCDRTTFRDCTFYGLSGPDSTGGALIYASHCDLRLERCGFRGCAWGGEPSGGQPRLARVCRGRMLVPGLWNVEWRLPLQDSPCRHHRVGARGGSRQLPAE